MTGSRRLTPGDLWAFLRAWTALLAADWGLRLLPFARVEGMLARQRGGGTADETAVPGGAKADDTW